MQTHVICFVVVSLCATTFVTSVTLKCVNYVSLINEKYSCRVIDFEDEPWTETIITDVVGKDVEGWNHGDIQQLFINNQSMSSIPNGLSDYFPQLLKMTLWNSKLVKIQEKNFQGLTNLVALFLSHNLISSINETVFNPLRNLEVLVLSYNKISKLNSRIFKGLPNLKIIELKSNRLEVIEDNLFENNPNLQEIELSFNNIKSFDPQMLHSFDSFRMINLQGNQCIDQLFMLNFNYKSVVEISKEISFNCSSEASLIF